MFKKIAVAAMIAAASLSQAAEVSVSKLRVNLEGAQTADFLTLLNQSETKKESFEVRLYKWTQKDSVKDADGKWLPAEEVLTDTDSVLVSPKTVVVLPKQDKIVRIILNNTDVAKSDYSYRMTITQLPSKEGGGEQNVVNLLFKISLPVFVYKDAIKKIETMNIEKTIVKEGAKNILVVKNNDTQHVQVQNLAFDGDKKISINRYVLPGVTDRFELPAEATPLLMGSLTLETDKGNSKIK